MGAMGAGFSWNQPFELGAVQATGEVHGIASELFAASSCPPSRPEASQPGLEASEPGAEASDPGLAASGPVTASEGACPASPFPESTAAASHPVAASCTGPAPDGEEQPPSRTRATTSEPRHAVRELEIMVALLWGRAGLALSPSLGRVTSSPIFADA
jgi:hypothetical protein